MIIVTSYHPDERGSERIERARETWPDCPVHETVTAERPRVAEMVDEALAALGPTDYVTLINADIELELIAGGDEETKLQNLGRAKSLYSHRIDYGGGKPEEKYCGADFFAFTPGFWSKWGRLFPRDLKWGTEGWDHVMKRIMWLSGYRPDSPPCICRHERHDAKWKQIIDEDRAENRRIAREWCDLHGFHEDVIPGADYAFHEPDPKQYEVAIVQTGRYGDIITCLPVAELLTRWTLKPVAWVVHQDYADLVRDCPNADPIIWTGDLMDREGAEAVARELATCVLNMRIPGHIPEEPKADRFQREMWAAVGLEPFFDEVPVPILCTDRKRVESLMEECYHKFGISNTTPVIAIAADGVSSPLKCAAELKRTIAEGVGEEAEIIDLDLVTAECVSDLLHLIGWCDLLIATDSAPLHLGWCAGAPTIALTADTHSDWHRSSPRSNWIVDIPYSEVAERMGEIVTTALKQIEVTT